MGTGKLTARRGANGEVEYEAAKAQRIGDPKESNLYTTVYNRHLEKGKASALAELYRSEEAAIRSKTSALASTVGGVTGTGAGYSSASSSTRAPEGNPGMEDPDASADIDLSTSDTTARRKAGYRRDNGIRI